MDKEKLFKLISGMLAVVFFIRGSVQTVSLTNTTDTLRPPSAVNGAGLTNESADLERALKTSSAEADTRKGPFIISENLEYNIVETEHLLMRLWLTAGEGSYLYTGFMTEGDHPRSLNGENIINDLGGLCSGPKLAKRFAAILKTADILYAGAVRAVIDDYRKKNLARERDLPDVNSILDILITQRELTKKEKMLKSKAEDAVLVGVDDAARKGNALAKEFIAGVGKEIGRALAAFIAAYQNEDFVKHIILVSGVNEKIGKGVTNEAGEDLYVAAIRKAAIDELIKNYKMPEDRAGNIAAGIERSDMTYEREFLAFTPQEGVNLAVSMGGHKLAVNLVNEKGKLLLKKSVELPWREKLGIAPEDKDFWKRENEVIASGVYENLARHIKDKNERDLYIGAIQDGAMYELTFIYGIDKETAKRFADTIRRDTKREAISLTIDIPAKYSSAGENFSKDAPFSENNPMPRQDKTQWDMAKAMSLTLGEKILTRALDMHTEHIIELKTLEELTIKAADMLVEYRKKHPGKIDIMHKDMADDGDPLTTAVTELEIRIQDFYINQLHQIFPSWRFVAEEGVVPELSDDGKADYVCMIDPVDGTGEFARRSDYSKKKFKPIFKHVEYGTGIALFRRLSDGRLKPLISVEILPEINIDEAGFSIGEVVDDIEGAFLNGKKIGIDSSAYPLLKDKDVIVETIRQDQIPVAERIAEKFRKAFVDVSSLCHFLFLASGEKYSDIAGYMLAKPCVWDSAIGGFIAQKAGAKVVYLKDGNNLFPIDPKRIDKDFRTDSIFAADPETVSYVFGQLKDTSDSRPGIKPASELIERGARIYTSIKEAA